MAVTNQELFNIFLANPNMSDAQIVSLMETRGISPEQVSSTFGIPVGDVISRAAATVAPGNSVTLGDTRLAPQYDVRGSGEDQQVGALENVITYKASDNQAGGNINYYSPTGEYQQTTQQQKVDTSLGGALKDIVSNPGFKIIAAAYGLDAALSAFGATGASAFAGEALADATAVSFTRNPAGLRKALEVLAADSTVVRQKSNAVAHIWIESPLDGKAVSKMFSTHPPIAERIAVLKAMESLN